MKHNRCFALVGYCLCALYGALNLPASAQNASTLPPPSRKVWTIVPPLISYIEGQPTMWVTNHLFLYGDSVVAPDQSKELFVIRQYDLSTDVQSLLEPLNKRLAQGRHDVWMWHPFSPDGRKLLCEADGVAVLSLEGTLLSSSYRGPNPICWLPNSRAWAELRIDQKRDRYIEVWVHSADGSAAISKLPISPTIPYSGPVGDGEPMPLTDGRLILCNKRIRYIRGGDTDTGTEEITEAVHLITFSFLPSSVRTKVISVHLPVQGVKADPYISPDGTLLVWRVRSSIEPQRKESLWVSHLDGTGARKILEVNGNAPSYDLAFRDVTWLPDGKQASFVYRGDLYIIPAD